VTRRDTDAGSGPGSSRAALVATYVVAAIAGCVLGLRGLAPPFLRARESSTPLARVGFALRQQEIPEATASDWGDLARDVERVRSTWDPRDRDVFDLVVAVRGLATGGVADWSRAEQLCRDLKWPRCDQPALAALRRSSRP